jgi:predicted nucleic acid-binding Zn ribbon protein
VGDRSRGRYATPADSPPHDGTPYRGIRVRRWGLGFVHHSRAIPIAPCQPKSFRFATFASLYAASTASRRTRLRLLRIGRLRVRQSGRCTTPTRSRYTCSARCGATIVSERLRVRQSGRCTTPTRSRYTCSARCGATIVSERLRVRQSGRCTTPTRSRYTCSARCGATIVSERVGGRGGTTA